MGTHVLGASRIRYYINILSIDCAPLWRAHVSRQPGPDMVGLGV